MTIIALLLSAALFGGMVFFSFGFAPVLFAQLTADKVRPLLRGTFPYYYLAVIVMACAAAAMAISVSTRAALFLAMIAVTTVYARQILMPQINAATDRDDQQSFRNLHGMSVLLQVAQIAVVAWVLIILARL